MRHSLSYAPKEEIKIISTFFPFLYFPIVLNMAIWGVTNRGSTHPIHQAEPENANFEETTTTNANLSARFFIGTN
jgi:hypothetical protein